MSPFFLHKTFPQKMLLLDILPTLIEYDRWLLAKINGEWSSDFLDAVYPYWRARTTWIPVYVALVAFVLYRYRRLGGQILAALAITMALANTISSELIKKTVQRTRPCREAAIQVRSIEGMDCSSGYSFTSSHSTNHFALSWSLIYFIPYFRSRRAWRWLLLFWAASIAYGQAYVAVHYPLDILCGALLGTLVAWGCYALYQRLQRSGRILSEAGQH